MLPAQSWNQYVDDTIGTGILVDDYGQEFQPFETTAFRDTLEQTEVWPTGNVSVSSPDKTPPIDEAHVCYGTVRLPTLVLYCALCLPLCLALTTFDEVHVRWVPD
jgi:hypothetical protein